MITLLHREDCSGCCACAAACPHGAIRMVQDGMGFRYPEIDKDLCVDCGLCEKVCAFKPFEQVKKPKAEAIRFPEYLDKSQSGGLGYAVMRKAIQEGYVVYGAAMDEDFVVRHRRVNTIEGLGPLRLSKYVQSDMNGIPAQILKDLKEGRKVLFTGTPCQCAGVGSLCSPCRKNLLLADLVCHGVPAPAVWKDYLVWQETRTGKTLSGAQFRDPSCPWNNLSTRLEFGEEKVQTKDYLFLFLKDLILRPSCFHCPFCNLSRSSDITMGDGWGIEKVIPGFADDDRGCSMLLVSTEAGAAFTDKSPFICERVKIPVEKMLQRPLQQPARKPRFADSFEKTYLSKGFCRAETLFGERSVLRTVERWMPRLNPFNTKLYRRLKKKLL